MDSYTGKKKHGPEWYIQQDIIKFLRAREWFVKSTHGSLYQSGFPDLFATHPTYKQRWIEVKLPNMKGSKFTGAQRITFPLMVAHGSGVWVLTGAIQSEYDKLFKECNWWQYLKF